MFYRQSIYDKGDNIKQCNIGHTPYGCGKCAFYWALNGCQKWKYLHNQYAKNDVVITVKTEAKDNKEHA